MSRAEARGEPAGLNGASGEDVPRRSPVPSLGGQQPTAHRSWLLLSALQEEPGLLGEMAAFRTRGREGQNEPGVCFLPKSKEVLRERGVCQEDLGVSPRGLLSASA